MSQKKAKGRGTMSRRMARAEAQRRRARRRRVFTRVLQIGIPIAVVAGGLLFVLARRGGDGTTASAVSKTSVASTTTTTAPPFNERTPTVTSCADATSTVTDTARGLVKPQFPTRPVQMIDPAKRYAATIETVSGTITAELSPTTAPITVNSFVFLARCGFFDGSIVARVSKDFVIQAGDPTGTRTGGPGYQLPDEALTPGKGYATGTLAMANSGPNTSGSQFFVITGDPSSPAASGLDHNYTPFGMVTAGLEVAKAIEQVPSTPEGDGQPNQDIVITSITIEER